MATYIRWFDADQDVWCYDELDEQRWSTRHIEVRHRDQVVIAAAALTEVLAARDAGGVAAVVAYERQCGTVPEAPFPGAPDEDGPPMEPITAEEFERLWQQARRDRRT